MGNGISRRRNRQEWTPGKEKRGSKDKSNLNGTVNSKSNVETTSATKIDGGNDGANGNSANVAPVASKITESSQEPQQQPPVESSGEKIIVTESTPAAAVNQQQQPQPSSSVMESTPDAPVAQTDVPPETPKSDPPVVIDAAATPAPPVESQVSESLKTDDAAAPAQSSGEQTSVPQVRVDDVKQDSAFDSASKIAEEVTAEGIKLAADIIRSNPVTSETSEPAAASTPEPAATDSAPTPEPTADPLSSLVPEKTESVTDAPAEPAPAVPAAEEPVKQAEPVVEQAAVKSEEQVAADHSLLVDSSASNAEVNAILAAKEPESPAPVAEAAAVSVPADAPATEPVAPVPAETAVPAPTESQPKAEEAVADVVPPPEKVAKSAEEQAVERESLIEAAASAAVTNGILLQSSQLSESVAKAEVVEGQKENKEAGSAPAEPVPNDSETTPPETQVPKSEPEVAAVEAVVPNGIVKDVQEPEALIHDNNNAKGGEAAEAAPSEAPAAVEA